MNRKIDGLGHKSTRRPIIISFLLSVPIFLIAAFVFTTPPEQIKDETSDGLSETPASAIIQRIDSENQNSLFPLLAQSNNNLYVAWQDNSSGTSEVFFKGSNNNGNSFRGMRNLSNNTGNSELPQIAAAGNNVYVAWQDNSSGTSEVLFKGSNKNGNGFRGMRNLSNNTGNSELPQIATAGNNVYVAWQDNSSGTSEVLFKGSNNNGNSFRGMRNLSNNTGNSELPQIAAAGNNVYVAWQDNSSGNYEVLLKVSNDGGKKFGGIKNLSNNTGNSELPQIAAAGNNVYVVWQDDTNSTSRNSDIQFKASITNGSKFRTMRILSNNTGNSELPQIAAAGNNVYVVWQDDTNSTSRNSDIQFKASITNGSKFRSIKNLSNNTGNSEFPQIAASGNNVYVTWQDNSSGTHEIYFRASESSGNTFPGIKNLSNTKGTSEFPQVAAAVDNSTVSVVWQDDSSGTNGVYLAQTSPSP